MEKMTYRSILKEELDFRMNENSSYSLRAYARDLEISPSQLSEILKGKSGLSSKKSILIAHKIGMSKEESLLFKALVEVEHGRSERIVNLAKEFIKNYNHSDSFKSLSLDGFKLISEWYYFGILSTMELDSYDGTSIFISNHLNLEISLVEDCIKRLLKLDIIDLKNGKFLPTGEMFTTTHNIQSSGLKKFHKGHISKSLKAIDDVPVELRDITSMTMAIDKEKISDAKIIIKKFRRELCEFLESDRKTDVYNLNIQFIPLAEKGN